MPMQIFTCHIYFKNEDDVYEANREERIFAPSIDEAQQSIRDTCKLDNCVMVIERINGADY